MSTLLPPLSPAALSSACAAWRDRGCQSLALWLAHWLDQTTGRRGYSVAQYGDLVRRVRAELNDTTDYSEADR